MGGAWFRGKKTGKYFDRLLISSLLLFLVPLVAWGVVYGYSQYANALDQIKEQQQADIDNAMRRLDAKLSSVASINGLLAANPLIGQIYKGQAAYTPYPTVILDVINSYCNSNSLISNIYLYERDSRGVYGRSTFLLFQFYSRIPDAGAEQGLYLKIDGKPYLETVFQPADFGRFLLHQRQLGTNPAQTVVLYSMPVYKSGGEVILLSTVEILPSSIAEDIRINAPETYETAVLLIDGEGTEIARVGQIVGGDAFAQAIAARAPQYKAVGENLLLQYAASNIVSWTAVVITDTHMVTRHILRSLTMFFLVLSFILVAGIVALAYVLRANYAPVYGIYTVAQDYVQSTQADSAAAHPQTAARDNELNIIHQAIDNLQLRVHRLSTEVSGQRAILEQKLWMDVINKTLVDPVVFEQRAQALGIPLRRASYCIVAVSFEGTMDEADSAYALLLEWLGRYASLTRISTGTVRRTPWLLSMAEGQALDRETLARVCEGLSQQLRAAMMVGVGRTAEAITAVSDSYFEAFTALDYCHLTGHRLALYEDIEDSNLSMEAWYRLTSGDTGDLAEAIGQGDMAEVHRALERIGEMIASRGLPINTVRWVCFDVHNTAIEALRAAEKPLQPIVSVNVVLELYQIHFVEDAKALLENLEQHIGQCMTASATRLDIDTIIQRIHAGYTNPDFSFNVLATELNVSGSSLSRFFSAQIGVLPIDYLTNLRIEKAKELLTFTDMPVSAVIQAVGYFSQSSFCKRFKSITELTPGEWRTQRQAEMKR